MAVSASFCLCGICPPAFCPGLVRMWLVVCVVLSYGLSLTGGGRAGTTGALTHRPNRDIYPSSSQRHFSRVNYRGKLYRWGPWGATSACTRTCGVGVRYKKRYCYKTSVEITMVTSPSLCGGTDRHYSLCNTQPCRSDPDDFRARQCAVHNGRPYRGQYYSWEPYKYNTYSIPDMGPCALVCTANNRRFTITNKFSNTVIDGTPCEMNGVPGVCVQSKCMTIGCDKRIHSKLKHDICGFCGGDNSSCHVRSGKIDKSLTLGYNNLLALPARARHIEVLDKSGSLAVFAIRNKKGKYFINGRHSITYPSVYSDVGGTTFLYIYDQDGIERIVADGPTNETLYIMMLSPHPAVKVQIGFKYAMPNEAASLSLKEQLPTQAVRFLSSLSDPPNLANDVNWDVNAYNWEPNHNTLQKKPGLLNTIKPSSPGSKPWVPTATQNAKRATNETIETEIPAPNTDIGTKTAPTKNETTDIDEITTFAGTTYVPITATIATETEEGTSPTKEQTNQSNSTVSCVSSSTFTITSSEPLSPTTEETKKLTFYWKSDKQTECSVTCSVGVRQKYSRCYRDDTDTQVSEDYCDPSTKPAIKREKCPTEREKKGCQPRWVASGWNKCSVSCGVGVQNRNVRCYRMMAPGFDSTVHDYLCDDEDKPITSRRCVEVDCGPQWKYSQWGDCSTECGHGTQRREVRCSSGPDDCDSERKPQSIRHCSSGPCTNKWKISPWSKCSGPCGTGVVQRSVTCRNKHGDLLHDKFCDQNRRPLNKQACGDKEECPPIWISQQWGVCSVACGDGITTRKVVCGGIADSKFMAFPDSKCSHLYKPATRGRCRETPCKAQWFTSEWSGCSETCGTSGLRRRTVTCYRGDKLSLTCEPNQRPPVYERCLLRSCSASPDDACHDTPGQDCAMIVKVNLCAHYYYREQCCSSCENYYKSPIQDNKSGESETNSNDDENKQ